MPAFAIYLLKVIICSGIAFGYYWLILRNKLFHQYNRFYLLAAVLLSLTIPLIQISIWHNADQPPPQGIKLLQVVNSGEYLDEIIIFARQTNFTTEQALLLIYSITSFLFFSMFIQALINIRTLIMKHRHSFVENVFFVNTTARGTPFSFFRYIFWNEHIDPETTAGNKVFRHELAHVQQKHSYDKLFMSVVLIFFWCNPFFWLIRKELNMIHEFVADKIAVEDGDTEAFAAMILQAAFPQHRFLLTNPFFYSPIKRRLMMLTKNRNPTVGYFGRLLVLPLTLLIFAAFTLKTKTFKQSNQSYAGRSMTVVIDAGHGGSDWGGTSLNGKILEKDLNLAIVKKVKLLNTNNKIKILLTRETDYFQTLTEKVAFTKAANADLFISIHVDANPSTTGNLKSGLDVYVTDNSSANSSGSQILASAIINEFNKEYELPVNPQPQKPQTTIRVLQDALCPSVLIETGNIANSIDLAYLQTDAAKQIIAVNILAAVEKWAAAKEKEKAVISNPANTSNTLYTVEKTDTIPEINLKNIEKALILVDGKAVSEDEFKRIKPENIESVNVITDKEGFAKYGQKGKNGVVIIHTRMKEIVFNDVNITVQQDSSIQKALISGKITIKNEGDAAARPLFIIDEKVQYNGFDINSIASDDIESINVLKDKKAIDKYGEKAINGAIEITTKSKDTIKEITFSNNLKNNSTSGTSLVRYDSDQEWAMAAYSIKDPTKPYTIRADVNINQVEQQPGKIFTKVENEPGFPGGDPAWKNYLLKNLKADMPLREGWKPGVYKIVLTFIVKEDGTIADIRTDNYAGSKTSEHCIDLIKRGPKWQPAIQNGLPVSCYRKQSITFVVSK
ncbi:MAG: N-acetylmuramoyl-L-alanine amidase [Ferruginibacter sp.]